MYEDINLSTTLSTFYYLFIITILVGAKWYLLMVLICISPLANNVEHLFMCSLVIWISSLEKCLFLLHFKLRNLSSFVLSNVAWTGCWYADWWWTSMEGSPRIPEKNWRTEGTLEYPFTYGLSCLSSCFLAGWSLVLMNPSPGFDLSMSQRASFCSTGTGCILSPANNFSNGEGRLW